MTGKRQKEKGKGDFDGFCDYGAKPLAQNDGREAKTKIKTKSKRKKANGKRHTYRF
jgi:hypothetical protein